jgi:hypothetical protein
MTQENREVVKNLPNVNKVKKDYTLNEVEKSFIESSKEQVREIFT